MQTHSDVYNAILSSGAWRQLPPSVACAVDVVDSPAQSDPERLAEAIEATPELSAIVLRHMNSAFYAPAQPVTDIKSAVVLLGFESIRNFMALYMTEYLLPNPRPPRSQFNFYEYWQHCLAASIAADMLGAKIGYTDRYRLFTHGLLHDIGIIVLEACLPDTLNTIVAKIAEGIPQIVAEKSVLCGLTHADIGAWVCHQWRLDPAVESTILYHHTPEMAPALNQELALLYIGNLVGTRIYESHMHIILGRSPVDERILAYLGLTTADVQAVDADLDAALEQFQREYALF